MDKALRNTLRNAVTQCRKLLETAISQELEGSFGIYLTGKLDPAEKMPHLSAEEQAYRQDLVTHLDHIRAGGFKPQEAVSQLVREVAFTHLNRLCAYKMMETRGLIRETVTRGPKSQGFMFYLADHPADEALWSGGDSYAAYRHFLEWLGATFADEISVLFSPNDPANRLFPPQYSLDKVLALINSDELKDIWTEDETIGWVYQYFTPKELRDQARKESQAPRNSYELAFRNQFYTPRYVVEFLTDNTLGRIWYEMKRGKTALSERCRYLVRRPLEIFLGDPRQAGKDVGNESDEDHIPATVQAAFRGDFATAMSEEVGLHRWWIALAVPPDQFEKITGEPLQQLIDYPHLGRVWEALNEDPEAPILKSVPTLLAAFCQFVLTSSGGPYANEPTERLWRALTAAIASQQTRDLSQGELLQQPAYIPYRAKKDPREILMLDPAGGSGHFGLYCFDLFQVIYEEAYDDPDLGMRLRTDYPSREAYRRAIPGLILAHNIHIIDIDPRACQIAALALWLRAQRAYQEMGIKPAERPKISKANVVCAEPMPGERELLAEFTAELNPPVLGQLVAAIFEKMKLAGEAGSLLKIEKEIQEVVAQARKQWTEGAPKQLFLLPDAVKLELVQLTIFDVSGIDDEAFWFRAEGLVLDALRNYAEHVAGRAGLRRRLFADDAAQGFAFVDICRKRYDVVLMNPPFGDLSVPSRSYVTDIYPSSHNDVYCAFIERGIEKTVAKGLIGAITPRSCFFLSQMSNFRHQFLLGSAKPNYVADLGENVLDMAMNEVACYTIPRENSDIGTTNFFRVLTAHDKGKLLLNAVFNLSRGQYHEAVHIKQVSDFSHLPDSPFVYWINARTAKRLACCVSFEPQYGFVRQGIATTDDPQFVRLIWEVPPGSLLTPPTVGTESVRESWASFRDDLVASSLIAGRWAFHVKAGISQPWYSPLTCVVDWANNGATVKMERVRRRQHAAPSEQYYFLPGISWTRRAIRIVPYVVPAGVIPSASRYEAFPDETFAFECLGATSSNVATAFARFYGEKFVWPNFLVENIRSLPFPKSPTLFPEALREFVQVAVSNRRDLYRNLEPFQEFTLPSVAHRWASESSGAFDYHSLLSGKLEKDLASCLGLDSDDYNGLFRDLSEALEYKHTDKSDIEGELEESDDQELVFDVTPYARNEAHISYLVGVALGRWDARLALRPELIPGFGSAFDPLPACPPAALIGPDGLPAMSGRIVSEAWLRARPDAISLPPPGAVAQPTVPDSEYPLRIDWDGILVDDLDHPDDIVRRVRDVLELFWGEQASAIEQEACGILGAGELRDYFRKSAAGGFWLDHVRRYSKSRRKAPIYWLLQSSRRNYALWLYYHRLDKDMLFKALVNYVEPKIRLEEGRLDQLRQQRTLAGTAGRQAKQLEKDIDRQVSFVTELYDFRDKLKRAADLGLEPDLNDGVVLNIAPLWELVPWKEAKDHWEELLAGKYEWSSIGKQLRAKGIVK